MGAYRDTFLLNKTIEVKNTYGSKIFIETGTGDGDSMLILHNHFNELFSSEIFPLAFKGAQNNTINCKNVFLYNENSTDFMNRICELFGERQDLIFFLDAHMGEDSPLLEELDIIYKHKIACPIIIHDFFVPDENGNAKFGFDKYKDGNLDYKYVKNHMDKIFNNSYNVYLPDEVIEPTGYAIFTKNI